MKTKEELIAALKIVREGICSYFGDRCDCKYGLSEETINRHENNPHFTHLNSEQTGCPELREVISLLEQITNEEIINIRKRKQTGFYKIKHKTLG